MANLKFCIATILISLLFGDVIESNPDVIDWETVPTDEVIPVPPEDFEVIKRFTQNRKRQTDDPTPDKLCINVKCVYNNKWNNKSVQLGYANGAEMINVVMQEAQKLLYLSDALGSSIKLVYETPTYDMDSESDGWEASSGGPWLLHSSLQKHVDLTETGGNISHYVFFTDDDGGVSESVTGVAFVGSMCYSDLEDKSYQKYKVSIAEYYSSVVRVGSTVAHEIGHAFGLRHDFGSNFTTRYSNRTGEDCRAGSQNVMDYVENRTTWSQCSYDDLRDFYNTWRDGSEFCLNSRAICNVNPEDPEDPEDPEGPVDPPCHDKLAQCQQLSYFCTMDTGFFISNAFLKRFQFNACPRTCGTCCMDKNPSVCAKHSGICTKVCSGDGILYQKCVALVNRFRNELCRSTCKTNGCP